MVTPCGKVVIESIGTSSFCTPTANVMLPKLCGAAVGVAVTTGVAVAAGEGVAGGVAVGSGVFVGRGVAVGPRAIVTGPIEHASSGTINSASSATRRDGRV